MKNMQTISCDGTGCWRPADWVRAADLSGSHENFLCQECWERLQHTHPDEARGYAAYKIHTNSPRRFFLASKTRER